MDLYQMDNQNFLEILMNQMSCIASLLQQAILLSKK